MPRFAVVSRERHGLKKWQRFNGYAFAATDALVPIVGAELARAAVSMPLAFSEQSGRATLVALLSLVPGHNMFVGPGGRWLGGPYVPAWLRLYPFRMLPQQDTGELVLCVDEESGLVVERNAAGEEFFDREGNVSPALKPVAEDLDGGGTQPQRHRPGCGRARASRRHSALADQSQDGSRREDDQRHIARRSSSSPTMPRLITTSAMR